MSIYTTIIGGEKFLGRNPEHLKDVLLNVTDGEIKKLGYSSEETNKLMKQRDELANVVVSLELDVKRLKEQLEERTVGFERNSGALSMLQILINNIVAKEKENKNEVEFIEENKN